MNRADAFVLLNEYVKDPSLIRHMLSVETNHRKLDYPLGAELDR